MGLGKAKLEIQKNETDFTIANKVNTIKDITILKKANTEKKMHIKSYLAE